MRTVFGRDKYNIGDVLETNYGMYKQFGVYIGHSSVIAFISDVHGALLNPEGARIKKVSINYFKGEGGVFVNNSPATERLPVSVIVKNAESELGSNLGGFNIINNNSEHFARWCETGRIKENQRNAVVNKVSAIAKGIFDLFN